MPITTAGTSAAVIGTFTNSSAIANGYGNGEITVFTTPNTANAIFIVNYTISIPATAPVNLKAVSIGVTGVIGQDELLYSTSTVTQTSVAATVRMAPNTALILPVTCQNDTSSVAASFGYRIRYDYLSLVIA